MRSSVLALVVVACGSEPAREVPVREVPIELSFEVMAEIDDRFLSVAIDTAQVVGAKWWDPSGKLEGGGGTFQLSPYDFTRPRLRRLAAELAPSYLRIGGSEADRVYYDLSDAPNLTPPGKYKAVMTRAQWHGLHDFARAVDFKVVFTLNAGPGPRDAQLKWTPDNTRALLEHARTSGHEVALWELGNEVNGFPVIHGLDFVIKGAAFADDVKVARDLLDAVLPGAKLAAPSSAYWPVAGEFISIYPEFMAAGGGRHLDVVTWHYYPTQSRRCPLAVRRAAPELMLDPVTHDEVDRWAAEVEKHAEKKPIWLGESGNAQCGGEPGISDAFAGGFWWLDQLGRLAKRGHQVVVRQTLSGSNYGLLDDETLEPRPDYWTSVLWRRLMGRKVLAARSPDPLLRVYAHCTRSTPGSVSLAVLNLDKDRAAKLILPREATAYVLAADALDGRDVKLNGVRLTAAPDGTLPPLEGAPRADVVLPPASYGFVTMAADTCR